MKRKAGRPAKDKSPADSSLSESETEESPIRKKKTPKGKKPTKDEDSDFEEVKKPKGRGKAPKKPKDESEEETGEENGDAPEDKKDSDEESEESIKKRSKKKKKGDSDEESAEENGNVTHKKKGGKKEVSKKKKKQKKSKKGKKAEDEEPEEGDEATKEDENDSDEQYEVESIIDDRRHKGTRQYLIRWKGYGPDDDTWEDAATLNCPDALKSFRELAKSDKKKPPKPAKKEKKKEEEVDWSSSDEFEVDRILEVHFKRNGKREFLVSWKGFPGSQDSWEPEENLECSELIRKFMEKVDAARDKETKDLRIRRAQTERFTLQMGGGSRRLSRRLGTKQRVQYHDAE